MSREKRGKMILKSKRPQVTIFIIVAIVIVAVVLIMFVLFPQLNIFVTEVSPQAFLESCIKDNIKQGIINASEQGGAINPEDYFLYKGEKVRYLCYTNKYYETCVMQVPLLKQDFEKQLNDYMKENVKNCLSTLKAEYERRGYSISLNENTNIAISIIPNSVFLEILSPITISKKSSQTFDKMRVVVQSGIYNMLMISTSILNWEARYGDSAPEIYMNYYPGVKIEKLKQSDGTKIYILTDRSTLEKFTFATRSLSWPPAYGFTESLG